jgi:hypothetical protein
MTEKNPRRTYPPIYEKIVPFAIILLAIVVIGMLVFTIAVGIGAIDFG